MKRLFCLFAACLICVASSAHAQPQAKEIAFAQPCPDGVPTYKKGDSSVTCGKLAQSGSGYVIELASQQGRKMTCPEGYSFIGTLDKNSLSQRDVPADSKLQYYACVKG